LVSSTQGTEKTFIPKPGKTFQGRSDPHRWLLSAWHRGAKYGNKPGSMGGVSDSNSDTDYILSTGKSREYYFGRGNGWASSRAKKLKNGTSSNISRRFRIEWPVTAGDRTWTPLLSVTGGKKKR